MRNALLYLGCLLNLCIAWHALVSRRADLFWWAVACGTLLAVSTLLPPPGRPRTRSERMGEGKDQR